jgi:hypothetical protein
MSEAKSIFIYFYASSPDAAGVMSDQDRIIVVRNHYVITELYNSVSTSEYPLSVSTSVIAS